MFYRKVPNNSPLFGIIHSKVGFEYDDDMIFYIFQNNHQWFLSWHRSSNSRNKFREKVQPANKIHLTTLMSTFKTILKGSFLLFLIYFSYIQSKVVLEYDNAMIL